VKKQVLISEKTGKKGQQGDGAESGWAKGKTWGTGFGVKSKQDGIGKGCGLLAGKNRLDKENGSNLVVKGGQHDSRGESAEQAERKGYGQTHGLVEKQSVVGGFGKRTLGKQDQGHKRHSFCER